MGRPSGGRRTCESCRSLDVRDLNRRDLLRAGLRFGWQWTVHEKRAADIRIETENAAVILTYRIRRRRGRVERYPGAGPPHLDKGQPRWQAAVVHMPGVVQRKVLREAGRQALPRRRSVRMPALLGPRLCEPAGLGPRPRTKQSAENQGTIGRTREHNGNRFRPNRRVCTGEPTSGCAVSIM